MIRRVLYLISIKLEGPTHCVLTQIHLYPIPVQYLDTEKFRNLVFDENFIVKLEFVIYNLYFHNLFAALFTVMLTSMIDSLLSVHKTTHYSFRFQVSLQQVNISKKSFN